MVELTEGSNIDLETIKNGGQHTYKGQKLEQFKCISDTTTGQVWGAYTLLSKELKAAGDFISHFITIHFPNQPGLIHARAAPHPDDPNFKDLTDAERNTKFNSVEYTTGQPEQTQIADGSVANNIGIEARNSLSEEDTKKNEERNKNPIHEERLKAADEAALKNQQETNAAPARSIPMDSEVLGNKETDNKNNSKKALKG